MRVLVFDSETTGLIKKHLPFDHEAQPRLVQLAAILHDDDRREVACLDLIVDPGIDIPMAASDIHGITNDRAARFGVPEKAAVGALQRLLRLADVVAAHNSDFDVFVSRGAAARSGFGLSLSAEIRCTMVAATHIVNLPPTPRMLETGFDKPKPPKLVECASFFFGEKHERAHSAMPDVRMCARVYYELLDRGAWAQKGAA